MHTPHFKTLLIGLLLFGITTSNFAAEPPTPPTENSIPSSVPSLDVNTEITIIQKKDATIEEIRVEGKLRYAKVTPKVGAPYYLYDSDGDGILDATETDIKKANVNQWILMQW